MACIGGGIITNESTLGQKGGNVRWSRRALLINHNCINVGKIRDRQVKVKD